MLRIFCVLEVKGNVVLCDQVGDFGLSRLKHATFLTTKTGKGTVLSETCSSSIILI